jgi:hypothetical protein
MNNVSNDSKKILIISFGIREYDGRLSELRNVFNKIGQSYTLCCSRNKERYLGETVVYIKKRKYLSIINYLKFFILSLVSATKIKNIDILVADNMFSSIPALIIRKIYHPLVVIQDVRELYFIDEIKKNWAKCLSKYET